MKIQFSTKTGNKQISDDDTTVQIQIGRGNIGKGSGSEFGAAACLVLILGMMLSAIGVYFGWWSF